MDQTLKYGSCVKRGTAGTRTDWAKESKKTEEAQNNRTSRKMNFMRKEPPSKNRLITRLSDKLE
jgi:hypothetical protein